MDKQNRISALKDKRSNLSSTKTDLEWALKDHKSDYRELVDKIKGLNRRLDELENGSDPYGRGLSHSYGPSLEETLQNAQERLENEKRRKTDFMSQDHEITEVQRLRVIREYNEKIQSAATDVENFKQRIEKRDRENQRYEDKRQSEMADKKGQKYRLQSNKESLKLLIERREARIKNIASKIKKINEQLRELGEW